MKSLVFLGLLGWLLPVMAAPTGIFSAKTQKLVVLDEALAAMVEPGSVVIIGENHGFRTHQTQQLAILGALEFLGYRVSVGLEFFAYPHQKLVNQFHAGEISEIDFLKAIGWGSPDFSYYREQALFANREMGAKTIALNAPRSLTGKVAKTGLESLTPDEKRLLPPGFTVGNEQYKKRFIEYMPHDAPEESLNRFFTAQSIWDDTMAWKAKEFLDANPDQILVIIVGEFHTQYGGGLPDRLKARGVRKVITVAQVDTSEIPDRELSRVIAPSPEYGERADLLWLAPAVP